MSFCKRCLLPTILAASVREKVIALSRSARRMSVENSLSAIVAGVLRLRYYIFIIQFKAIIAKSKYAVIFNKYKAISGIDITTIVIIEVVKQLF